MRAFVEALWPGLNYAGNITFWFHPSKKSVHVPLCVFSTLEEDEIAALHADNEAGENVYIGLGLRRDGLLPSQQGAKADIVAIPGWALDIDKLSQQAHKATNLPVTDEDAYRIIERAPDPTIIINSGNGWHVYWLFREPWLLQSAADRAQAQKAYKAFQKPFIARAREFGWHLDNTASIQRVWRVPGFINHKNGTPVSTLHVES
jgi:putative DNA primase/helicase